MPGIVRFGLIVLCLFGLVVGSSIFFGGDLPVTMCGKSCAFNRALVALFGAQFAKLLLSAIWFLGAAAAGWLAIRRNTKG